MFGSEVPKYQAPPPSAEEVALKQQTERQNIEAIQGEARTDTSRLMALYGTRLAIAGGSGSFSPLLNMPGTRSGDALSGFTNGRV